jgi:hypothetical protein
MGLYLSVWNVSVNGRKEQFATNTPNIESVLSLYKVHFKRKNPDKAFNFESIERVTGIEYLSEITADC